MKMYKKAWHMGCGDIRCQAFDRFSEKIRI